MAGLLQYLYDNTSYAVIMQPEKKQVTKFKTIAGNIFQKIRKSTGKSQRKFADEYEIDRGNMSRLERGLICCNLLTAWKITEAANIDFVEFAQILKEELGDNFKLMDE